MSGFDCILGNPPWERVKLQEKEWFAQRVPDIANAPNAATRTKMINALKGSDPEVYSEFLSDVRAAEAASTFMRNSGRYPLCGRGDVNLYTVFAESMRDRVSPIGRVGCIVPSGIVTDDTTKFFFQSILGQEQLVSFFEFENEGFFPSAGQGHMLRFALMTLARQWKSPAAFIFQCLSMSDLEVPSRRFTLTTADLMLLNPNTRTCPIFRTEVDAELTKYIYRRVPVLVKEATDTTPEENLWGVEFKRLFDMSNDSGLFRTREQLEKDGWRLRGNVFERGAEKYLPLYEAKMVSLFQHRHGSYETLCSGERSHVLPRFSESRLAEPGPVQPCYWVTRGAVAEALGGLLVPSALLGWRDVTDARASARTLVSALIPAVGVGDKFLIMRPTSGSCDLLAAQLGSFAIDYCSRQKVAGLALKFFTMRQLPVLPPSALGGKQFGEQSTRWIGRRVLELSATADDMYPFSRDLWPEGDGAVFRYDPERRFEIRCELDAAFFHLYLGTADEWRAKASPELLTALPTPRDAVAYMMETFPIVKKRDIAAQGVYRTKERILALYDQLQLCLTTNTPFLSALTPPPGPPTNADGTFAKLPPWPKGAPRPANYPAHLHPPITHREGMN